MTACYPLETYQVGDKKKAEALVKDNGFVNLIQVEASGSMARDCHAICGRTPDLRVESIRCEQEMTNLLSPKGSVSPVDERGQRRMKAAESQSLA